MVYTQEEYEQTDSFAEPRSYMDSFVHVEVCSVHTGGTWTADSFVEPGSYMDSFVHVYVERTG